MFAVQSADSKIGGGTGSGKRKLKIKMQKAKLRNRFAIDFLKINLFCSWGEPLDAFDVRRTAVNREKGLQLLRGLEPKILDTRFSILDT
jgi:hypothetical protein